MPPVRPFALLLCTLPFIVLMAFIAVLGVNVPYGDSLPYMQLFASFYAGTATLREFFQPNFEHIFAVPLFVMAVILKVTHGGYKAELFVAAGLAFANALILGLMVLRMRDMKKRHAAVIVLCIALLISAFTQLESWTDPFILPGLLSETTFFAALWFLSKPTHAQRDVWIAAILCFLSSFSFPNGMLSWIVLFPLVLRHPAFTGKRKKMVAALWILCFVLTVFFERGAVSNIRYITDQYLFPLHHPWHSLRMFLTLIGAPLLPVYAWRTHAAIIGVFLLVTGICACIAAIRKKERHTQTLPWISLFFFATGSAVMIALGRSYAGDAAAFVTRFYTVTQYVAISVLVLTAAVFPRLQAIVASFACVVCLSTISFSVRALPAWYARSIVLRQGKACLETWTLSSRSCLSKLYPWTIPSDQYVGSLAPLLEKLGFLKPFTLPADVRYEDAALSAKGAIESIAALQPSNDMVAGSGTLIVRGYATLDCAPAEHVYLTWGTPPILLAHTLSLLPRPDLDDPCLQDAGWAIEIDPPKGSAKEKISAWVYDSPHNSLIRLSGSLVFPDLP